MKWRCILSEKVVKILLLFFDGLLLKNVDFFFVALPGGQGTPYFSMLFQQFLTFFNQLFLIYIFKQLFG